MSPALHRARPYWRIGVVALLGGLVAFMASFLVEETYASSTRLLIRGREATFLTTSGQDLSRQPGIVDASMATALGETQAGLATSREVATAVVDHLDLTNRPEKAGVVAAMARGAADVYGCARALITFGFCRDADPQERAIGEVQGSLSAAPLDKSYVLELVGTADDPELARDITDAAADALVEQSGERSRAESTEHAAFLGGQVESARAQVSGAASAVRDFKAANGITDLDQQLVLSATGIDALRTRLAQTDTDLRGAQAQLASLESAVASSPVDTSTEQVISTGRGETRVATAQPSGQYLEAVRGRDAAAAEVARLQAEQALLGQQVASVDASDLPAEQATLLQLEQDLTLAQTALADLSAQHQAAQVSAAQTRVELTRIDTASRPNYPIAPKRYLYLALGLLLGVLAGAGLTWLALRRQPLDDDGLVDELVASGVGEREIDLRPTSLFDRGQPEVPVGTGNGRGFP